MKNRYALNTFGNFILFSLSEFNFWKTFPIHDFFCLAQWVKAIFKVVWKFNAPFFIFKEFRIFFSDKIYIFFFLMLVFFLSCSICQIIFEFTLDLIQSYFVKFAFYFRQKHYKFPKYTRCAKIWMKHHIGWNPIFEFWMFITIFQQKLLFHTCCLMAIKEKWKCNCMA